MISSQQDNRVTHVVSDKVVGTTANNQGASANNSPVVGGNGGDNATSKDKDSKNFQAGSTLNNANNTIITITRENNK